MVVQCNTCSFTHHYKCRVRAHQNQVHSDLKPWKCSFPLCTLQTNCKRTLKKHQKVHETNPEVKKPYSCSVDGCNYRATEKHAIAGHIRTRHTPGRTKDSQCPLCPLKFYSLSELKVRIPRLTKEDKFACSKCNFKTLIKSSLERHVRWLHDQTKELRCSF